MALVRRGRGRVWMAQDNHQKNRSQQHPHDGYLGLEPYQGKKTVTGETGALREKVSQKYVLAKGSLEG